jgi:large subunit ribosomal protein L10e
MARLRKFVAFRKIDNPYTRRSKYKKKNFIKASPNVTIVRYHMGDPNKKYSHQLNLCSKSHLQIRHNALESARTVANRVLELTLGKNFHLHLRPYPHHIVRENPLAAGAGADRFSTGMAHPFGKPITSVAQIKRGQPILTLDINKQYIDLARKALHRAATKLPCSCTITVIENK